MVDMVDMADITVTMATMAAVEGAKGRRDVINHKSLHVIMEALSRVDVDRIHYIRGRLVLQVHHLRLHHLLVLLRPHPLIVAQIIPPIVLRHLIDADLAEERVTKEIAVAEASADLLDPLVLPDPLVWMVQMAPQEPLA